MHGYVCTCAWSENIRGTTSISSAGAFGLAKPRVNYLRPLQRAMVAAPWVPQNTVSGRGRRMHETVPSETRHPALLWLLTIYLFQAKGIQTPRHIVDEVLTVPVAASSPSTQSTPSKEAFFTAQIAPMMAFWSPLPSATKSGYRGLPQSSSSVDPTCKARRFRRARNVSGGHERWHGSPFLRTDRAKLQKPLRLLLAPSHRTHSGPPSMTRTTNNNSAIWQGVKLHKRYMGDWFLPLTLRHRAGFSASRQQVMPRHPIHGVMSRRKALLHSRRTCRWGCRWGFP